MGYLRFGWTVFMTVIMFIISLPIMLIIYITGLFNMDIRDRMTMTVVRVAFSLVLFFAGTRVHISGRENIPEEGAVLYIGNHKSFFDVLVSYKLFPRMTAFIAKKEFAKVPLFSWWMRMLHNLFLDRDDIKQGLKTMLKAIDYAKNGMSVCIFPEGTRNKSEEPMLPFHEGSFKVAEKTGCPIVPMTMYNMSSVFEDHFPQITREDVYIHFGEPFCVKDLSTEDRKHLGAYTRNIMLEKYEELRKQHEESNVR